MSTAALFVLCQWAGIIIKAVVDYFDACGRSGQPFKYKFMVQNVIAAVILTALAPETMQQVAPDGLTLFGAISGGLLTGVGAGWLTNYVRKLGQAGMNEIKEKSDA